MATLHTAYCTRAGAPGSQVNRAEVHFVITKPGGSTFGGSIGQVGRAFAGSLFVGSNVQYDTSPIPLNASVVRAKIVMTAAISKSSVFDSVIGQFMDSSPSNQNSVTSAIHQHFKFRSRARDTASTQLALAGATTDFDLNVVTTAGCRSAGQVLVLTSAGNGELGSVSMWLRQTASNSGTCKANVYSTTGVSGSYSRDELIASSNTRPMSDINVSPTTSTELAFTLTTPLPIVNGQVLIVEATLDPVPTDIFVGGDSGFLSPQENALNFGTTMAGFGSNIYGSGFEQGFGNGDRGATEFFVFPTFTAGSQLSLGDALYSPDVTLTSFTSWVQEGLDAREASNRLAFSFNPAIFAGDIPDPGELREWRSADNTTPQTVDGQSFFGTVLQVEYTLPGAVKAFPARARPAVTHGEVSARPAVSSPAKPRARVAVRTAEEPRARPAIQRGEARARPTVRRP